MAESNVIQGSFPDGWVLRPATAAPVAAQAKVVQPKWAQDAIARIRPPATVPAAPVQPHAAGRVHAPAVRQLAGGTATQLPAAFAFSSHGPGDPLPRVLQRQMEGFFKASFSDVRVHVGQDAASIGAFAMTRGTHVYFAPGQYSPDTARGRQLLAHELAHVVQQRSGRVVNPFGSGLTVVRDRVLEAEADRMSRQAVAAVQLRPAQRGTMCQPMLTPARVLALHGTLATTNAGYRTANPTSALQSHLASADRESTLATKAAALAVAILGHDVFQDGNGRTAILAIYEFLEEENRALDVPPYIVQAAIRPSEDSSTQYDLIREGLPLWLAGHIVAKTSPRAFPYAAVAGQVGRLQALRAKFVTMRTQSRSEYMATAANATEQADWRRRNRWNAGLHAAAGMGATARAAAAAAARAASASAAAAAASASATASSTSASAAVAAPVVVHTATAAATASSSAF